MLSFIIFALVCAVRAWTVFDYASNSIQHCHLLLVADAFCGSVFPAFVLAFLFAHHVVIFQYDASGFCSHGVLNGSYAGLSWDCSLCLAMLFVIHLFGRALRLIEQVMPRIPRCQFFRLPTSFAYLIFALVGIGRQFSLCANISKKHLKTHKTNFSNISKTLTRLLKHLKGTKQTSQTSQRHWTNILNTSNCATKGSHQRKLGSNLPSYGWLLLNETYIT